MVQRQDAHAKNTPASPAAKRTVREYSADGNAGASRTERFRRAIFAGMERFVALLDPHGRVLDCPALAGRDLIGRPFWQAPCWISEKARAEVRAAVTAAAAGERVRFELLMRGSDAPGDPSRVILDVSLKPLYDEAGQIEFLLAEGWNVTDRKAAEREEARKSQETQALCERLREFDRLKTEFFANVSHELRTPLTLILGPIRRRLSQLDPIHEENRDLRVVERNAGLLLKHVNNLLDLSKLEAGQLTVQYAETDLARLGRFVASHFEVLAEELHVRFTVDIPEELPAQADAEKLQRILLNLLSNAFKHCPTDGEVTYRLWSEGDHAVFTVQDTGTGIPPELRQSIFERFHQADNRANRRLGGTGLGLSIAREFALLHGGEITVDDAPGGGALFLVRLPLRAPAGQLIGVSGEEAHEEISKFAVDELRCFLHPQRTLALNVPPNAPLVLVVEDNPEMSEFLVETVGREYRVVTASNGREGLKKALQYHPDLVLSDVMMPEMNGGELVRAIRASRKLDDVPIVLLTAKADDGLQIELLEQGAMGYLHKPFSAGELMAKVRRLVRERRRGHESLRKANELLRAVMNGVTDAVFVKDLQGGYLMINPAGAQHLRATVDEVLGKDDSSFFSPATAEEIQRDDREVIATGTAHTYERRLTDRQGTTRTYFTTKVPYRDQNGNVIGVMGIARDITERKQGIEDLRQAKEAAEAANQAKDHFLAVLSHELRTPLTPALASVNYIEAKPDLDPELRRQITMIRRNVEMEARLIDDLLDLTRISRGKIELHPEALDAHASLRRALEICHNDIEEKRLELTLGLWAERHFIWGDPARMQQVFWNLINNAVKFTPKGGRISLRTTNVADGRFELIVRDTGVGIEREAIPRIFNAFEQGERTVTRRFGGLGLGLAITKTLVDMHEGTLAAESEGCNRGATFRLTLGTIEQTVEDMKNPPASRSADHKPLRILLVDDHEDTLQMMARLLGLYGHEVQTAANVRDALDLADRDPFDLLISDIGLPDGSGLDIIRQVRGTRGIKGIALSGFGMEEDLRRSREAGFERHLTKPVDLNTLEEAIQQVAT